MVRSDCSSSDGDGEVHPLAQPYLQAIDIHDFMIGKRAQRLRHQRASIENGLNTKSTAFSRQPTSVRYQVKQRG